MSFISGKITKRTSMYPSSVVKSQREHLCILYFRKITNRTSIYPSSVIKSQREQIEQKVRKVFKKLHFLFNTEDRSFDMFSLKTFRLHKGEGVSLEIEIYSVMQLDRNSLGGDVVLESVTLHPGMKTSFLKDC